MEGACLQLPGEGFVEAPQALLLDDCVERFCVQEQTIHVEDADLRDTDCRVRVSTCENSLMMLVDESVYHLSSSNLKLAAKVRKVIKDRATKQAVNSLDPPNQCLQRLLQPSYKTSGALN